MSDEERHQRIEVLEEEGRRDEEKIRAKNHRKSLQSKLGTPNKRLPKL